jgi:hypothetical protein
MHHSHTRVIAGVAGALLLSALAAAQNDAPRSPWKYYPEEVRANDGDGGPAPKRDLTGTWAGPTSGAGVPEGDRMVAAPPTPLGRQLNDKILPLGIYSPAGTNDPHVRYCDPLGFPRNMNEQLRGMTITTLPDRTFVLLMFMNIWREVWTDGRALPTNFARGRDAHDPTYNGYSVGRWEDDYTFVVETTGMAAETWVSRSGYAHSVDARVTERYHRKSRNDLTLTMTMEDPKLYTGTFRLGETHFRWVPNQTLFDFTCIPSSVQRYLKEMGDPAGSDPDAGRREQGGRGRSGGPSGPPGRP